jgi:hypothetical protein
MPRLWGRGTTKNENRAGPREISQTYFLTKPPCPAFGGVAPRNMEIGLGKR